MICNVFVVHFFFCICEKNQRLKVFYKFTVIKRIYNTTSYITYIHLYEWTWIMLKHFPFNCFHTVAPVLLVKSQGTDLDCRKELVIVMNSQEFLGKMHECQKKKKKSDVSFLVFLDYPHFQNYKNAMRQNIPQVRVKCVISHQKCQTTWKLPLFLVRLIN